MSPYSCGSLWRCVRLFDGDVRHASHVLGKTKTQHKTKTAHLLEEAGREPVVVKRMDNVGAKK